MRKLLPHGRPPLPFRQLRNGVAPDGAVKVDFDGAEASDLKSRYRINDTPAILVVSPGGALIFRMVGFDNDRAFYTHLHNSMVDSATSI